MWPLAGHAARPRRPGPGLGAPGQAPALSHAARRPPGGGRAAAARPLPGDAGARRRRRGLAGGSGACAQVRRHRSRAAARAGACRRSRAGGDWWSHAVALCRKARGRSAGQRRHRTGPRTGRRRAPARRATARAFRRVRWPPASRSPRPATTPANCAWPRRWAAISPCSVSVLATASHPGGDGMGWEGFAAPARSGLAADLRHRRPAAPRTSTRRANTAPRASPPSAACGRHPRRSGPCPRCSCASRAEGHRAQGALLQLSL